MAHHNSLSNINGVIFRCISCIHEFLLASFTYALTKHVLLFSPCGCLFVIMMKFFKGNILYGAIFHNLRCRWFMLNRLVVTLIMPIKKRVFTNPRLLPLKISYNKAFDIKMKLLFVLLAS